MNPRRLSQDGFKYGKSLRRKHDKPCQSQPSEWCPQRLIRKVTPRRPKTGEIRTREYLTEREVEQLIEGCKGNRQPHRDQTMILLAFRHGLRASELCDLQWTQVDFDHAT